MYLIELITSMFVYRCRPKDPVVSVLLTDYGDLPFIHIPELKTRKMSGYPITISGAIGIYHYLFCHSHHC